MNPGKAIRGKGIVHEVVPGIGQMAVAGSAVYFWTVIAGVQFKWYWVGAVLWTVAVALKMLCAWMISKPAIRFLHAHFPYPAMVAGGGLFTGLQSSLFEMGATLLAVLLWPALGRDAQTAIAVGVGAGAFEAFLLGLYSLFVGVARLIAGAGEQTEELIAQGPTKRLLWLVPPVERTIAVLCHASSRALILLGAVHGDGAMVFWGIALFTLLDGAAGAAHISGKLESLSFWWIELALSPLALISVPILVWLCDKYAS